MRKSLRLSLLCGVAAPCLVVAACAFAQTSAPDQPETAPRQYELHRASGSAAAATAPVDVPVITPSQKPLSVTIPNAAAVEQPAQISGEMNTHDRYYSMTQEQLASAEKAKQKSAPIAAPPQAAMRVEPTKPAAPVAAAESPSLPPLPAQLVQPPADNAPVKAAQPTPAVQVQAEPVTPVQQQLDAPSTPTHQLQTLQPKRPLSRKMPAQNPRQGNIFERAYAFMFGSDAPSDANPAPADLSTPPVVMAQSDELQDAPEGTPPPSILMPAGPDISSPSLPMSQEAKKGQPSMQVYAAADAEAAPVAAVQEAPLPPPEQQPAPVVNSYYRSPEPIIHREVLRPETQQPELTMAQAAPQRLPQPMMTAAQAAEMQPAAGGDDQPLIATPTVPPADKPASAPVASTVATLPETPAAPPPPVAPADAQLLDALMPTPATPAPAVSASVPEGAIKRWQDGSTPAPEVMPPMKPLLATPVTPAPAVIAAPPAATIVPDASVMQSEPQPALSDASKKIADKLPPNIGKKKAKSKEPIDVEHAKDTSGLIMKETPPPGPASSTMQNVMGVKIEIKKPPVNQDYELEKAYNAMLTGHTESAMEIYKTVLVNDPNNKTALFGMATAFHRAGQLDQARPYYGRLLAIDPNNRDGLNNFLVLLADEAPAEALTQLTGLQQKNPQFSPIPAQMAVIYNKMGDYDNANASMLKAIELSPENLTYRYNFAVMLDKQKRFGEAAKLYGEIVSAYQRGETVPGNIQKIQQRLTYIRNNRP